MKGFAGRRPSRFPGCPTADGGCGSRGPGVPAASHWKRPLWLQAASSPALPGAGHICTARARLARPKRPEGGVFAKGPRRGTERPGRATAVLRPGLQGPEGLGRRAAAVSGNRAGPGAGRLGGRAVGEARDLWTEGTASGESPQPRGKLRLSGFSQGGRSSSWRTCLLPWVFNSCFVGADSSFPTPHRPVF